MARPQSFAQPGNPFDNDAMKRVSIRQFIGNVRQLPEMYGQEPIEFYTELLGGQGRRKNTSTEKTEYEFNLPWAMELKNLIRRFNSIPENFRQYVKAANQDGVKWRGEEFAHFRSVYDETIAYMNLNPLEKGKYRFRLSKSIKGLAGAMTQ